MRDLHGRTAVITGAAGGIGRALAVRLADEGCRLALVDRDGERLDEFVAGLPPGVVVSRHVHDLSEREAADRLAAEVADRHGGAALLVCNAGLTVHGAFAEQTAADIDRLFAVNLGAVVHGTRAFLPQLRAARGHLVLVSSMAAMIGVPFQSTYSASKSAVRAFGEVLRIELAPDGVGVSTVLPGTIATPFLTRATSYDVGASSRMADLMLRFGTPPTRVADAVVRAVHRDRGEVRVGWDAHLTHVLQTLAPGLLHRLLKIAWSRAVVDGRVASLR